MATPKLVIDHVWKRYWREKLQREVIALKDISFTVGDGEFVAIVGPSGCGKTSLMNIVAGLLPYEEGVVSIDGKKVDGPGVDRAVVFQNSSLLPWRTIAGKPRFICGTKAYGRPPIESEFPIAPMKQEAERVDLHKRGP